MCEGTKCNDIQGEGLMESQQSLVKGSTLVIIGFFFMAVFGVLTKEAYVNDSGLWISFITYAVSTTLLFPFVLVKGLHALRSEHYAYHFCRAAFGCAASLSYMLSMHYIPLVNSTLLFNAAPIYLPILAIVLTKAEVSKRTWFAIFLGFVGVIIIIKPTLQILQQPGDLIGLASGISLAIAYFTIKLLSSTDPSFRIIFYYFFLSVLLQLPLLFWAGDFPPVHAVLYASLAGLSLLLAQFFIVEGYRYAPVSKIGVFQYTSVVFVGLLNWIIWGTLPTLSEVLGVFLVVLAAYFIMSSGEEAKPQLKKSGV